ncbi:MAG: LysM peptidoglycan-binding domain-containing protein, partial [Bacteroidetes bacterium]|nr:LysM peptidoglycan-binding domain-containing protein [Bacteroidota bacterium]
TYAKEHKIYPVDPGILYYEVDTVTIRNPLSFSQISEMLSIPMDEVMFLNPSFKHQVIPATPENPYKLRLRKKYIGNFINNESALYAYRTKEGLASEAMAQLVYSTYRESELYTVKSGETVSSVAKKFHMTPGELKSLNGLKKSTIKPGKKILVYTNSSKGKPIEGGVTSTYAPQPLQKDTSVKTTASNLISETVETQSTASDEPAAVSKTVHIVKSGESLGIIASKYHCTTAELMKWNNLTKQTILVGQKIKIVPGGNSSAAGKSETNAKPKTTPSGSSKYSYYTIQQGDNLWGIAGKFDVTVSQLKTLNNLKNNSRLQAGQKIKIPK